ncbi:MAG TPA: serine hydrolase [Sedimentisphaerales bacterium]|nr:serine hydrolase [Sedimentisphaerales bacterium]
MRTRLIVIIAVLSLGGLAHAAPVYPGREWATKPPGEAGLSADALKAFSDRVGGSGCVVRHGTMVYSWGDPSRRMDVASAAKPIYAHFLFRAVEDRRIPDVNQPVCEWEPRLKEINAGLGHKDSRITWRHMANQISCYGLAEEPGTAYAYNDWQMALFFDTLFTKVYGATHATVDSQVLHPLLTDAIGCQDDPTFLAFGEDDRPGRLAISPRDFARFGLLYLRGGTWGDRQLLSEKPATMAVTSPVANSIPRAGRGTREHSFLMRRSKLPPEIASGIVPRASAPRSRSASAARDRQRAGLAEPSRSVGPAGAFQTRHRGFSLRVQPARSSWACVEYRSRSELSWRYS